MEYQPNENPSPSPITLDGAPADGATVAANAKVTLSVGWPEPEHYPGRDVAYQMLVEDREAMRVSCYASAGTLAAEHTGVSGDDPALSTTNTLTAPASGTVQVWAVLRDDRGGVGWRHARLIVSP
jgi:hypothetical protein